MPPLNSDKNQIRPANSDPKPPLPGQESNEGDRTNPQPPEVDFKPNQPVLPGGNSQQEIM